MLKKIKNTHPFYRESLIMSMVVLALACIAITFIYVYFGINVASTIIAAIPIIMAGVSVNMMYNSFVCIEEYDNEEENNSQEEG